MLTDHQPAYACVITGHAPDVKQDRLLTLTGMARISIQMAGRLCSCGDTPATQPTLATGSQQATRIPS